MKPTLLILGSLLLFKLPISNSFKEKMKTIEFNSSDGLPVTADLYFIDEKAPFILLCHQARFSRGEYSDIAPKLNELGFNCLAIDQRSGESVNGIKNETAVRAMMKNLPNEYLDAKQDIISAIEYIYSTYKCDVILLGSSYSASLALRIGAKNEHVKGIVAFSPGEYFGDKMNIKQQIQSLDKPTFVSSSKDESSAVKEMVSGLSSVTQFVPETAGVHGAKALWPKQEGHEAYWKALKNFLEPFAI